VDIISPNETELERVINKRVNTEEELKQEIGNLLLKYPSLKVLLKEGENGSSLYYLEGDNLICHKRHALKFEDHPHLNLIDTTGAGDCFTGAFACKILDNAPYEEALEFAN
jgi:ribokinase